MPKPSRSRLLAFALVAFALSCGDAEARHEAVPLQPTPKLTIGTRAAAIALKAVGIPYRWGGASPTSGFDCSGLVYWAYGRLGIDLPHSSYALYDRGRWVARSRMRAGDVLFFSGLGHVGIYVGRGRMVHAPHSGTDVRVVSLRRSSYGARLIAVRRLGRT